MPELAEVEYYRKRWLPGVGKKVAGVRLNRGKRVFRETDVDRLESGLRECRLLRLERAGKQLLAAFDGGRWLGLHLGMTGRLAAVAAGAETGFHDHLNLVLEDGSRLVFADPRMFGRVRYGEGAEAPAWWRTCAPEILSDAFTEDVVAEFLDRRAKAPIKAVLLMQDRFPGLGNWMTDEILWRARIHPAVPAGMVGGRKRGELFAAIRGVGRDALKLIGTEWRDPPESWLFPHRWRAGGRCPATGGALQRGKIGGRTACWSPRWQVYRGRSGGRR